MLCLEGKKRQAAPSWRQSLTYIQTSRTHDFNRSTDQLRMTLHVENVSRHVMSGDYWGGEMRRKYAEITDVNEIVRILSATNIGRMATIDSQGYPYIIPVNFVFHEGCVYFHCALQGEKLDNLTRNPKVCFEADVPLAYLAVDFTPEKDPCCTHQYYHCVIIRGLARVLPDGELKTTALNLLMVKHEGNSDFSAITEQHVKYKMCNVVEVKPERMTGKSDLAQNKSPIDRRNVADRLASRGLPGDLEAVRDMGFKLERNETGKHQLAK